MRPRLSSRASFGRTLTGPTRFGRPRADRPQRPLTARIRNEHCGRLWPHKRQHVKHIRALVTASLSDGNVADRHRSLARSPPRTGRGKASTRGCRAVASSAAVGRAPGSRSRHAMIGSATTSGTSTRQRCWRLDQLWPRLLGRSLPVPPVAIAERPLPGQGLVQGDPEPEDVRPQRPELPLRGGSACSGARYASVPVTWSSSAASAPRARDAEVDQPRRRPHDDVARLDVEVHHRLRRQIVQRRAELQPEREAIAPSTAVRTGGPATRAADRRGARAQGGVALHRGRRRTTARLPGATAWPASQPHEPAPAWSTDRRPGLGAPP